MRHTTLVRPIILLTVVIFANSVVLNAQRDSIYRLPAGTRIRLKLDVELSSGSSSVNDTFLAHVMVPVVADQTVVLPAGAVVEGRVTDVARAAHGGRDGRLNVVFESLKLEYGMRRIEGTFVSKSLKEQTSKSFLTSFLEIIVLKKGSEARIRKDQEFEIELRREVTLPVFAY